MGKTLFLGHADTGIKSFKGKAKENKIIFFARLVYRKGIFDFILIVKEILKSLRVEVHLMVRASICF